MANHLAMDIARFLAKMLIVLLGIMGLESGGTDIKQEQDSNAVPTEKVAFVPERDLDSEETVATQERVARDNPGYLLKDKFTHKVAPWMPVCDDTEKSTPEIALQVHYRSTAEPCDGTTS